MDERTAIFFILAMIVAVIMFSVGWSIMAALTGGN